MRRQGRAGRAKPTRGRWAVLRTACLQPVCGPPSANGRACNSFVRPASHSPSGAYRVDTTRAAPAGLRYDSWRRPLTAWRRFARPRDASRHDATSQRRRIHVDEQSESGRRRGNGPGAVSEFDWAYPGGRRDLWSGGHEPPARADGRADLAPHPGRAGAARGERHRARRPRRAAAAGEYRRRCAGRPGLDRRGERGAGWAGSPGARPGRPRGGRRARRASRAVRWRAGGGAAARGAPRGRRRRDQSARRHGPGADQGPAGRRRPAEREHAGAERPRQHADRLRDAEPAGEHAYPQHQHAGRARGNAGAPE